MSSLPMTAVVLLLPVRKIRAVPAVCHAECGAAVAGVQHAVLTAEEETIVEAGEMGEEDKIPHQLLNLQILQFRRQLQLPHLLLFP